MTNELQVDSNGLLAALNAVPVQALIKVVAAECKPFAADFYAPIEIPPRAIAGDLEMSTLLPPGFASAPSPAAESTQSAALAEDTFRRLPFGMALVDGERSMRSPNAAMLRFLDRADGLFLDSQQLHARTPADHEALVQALDDLLVTGLSTSVLLSFSRQPGNEPYHVLLEKFVDPDVATVPLCRLVMVDPQAIDIAVVNRIGRRFRLTQTEVRVVHCFLIGLDVNSCAGLLKLSVATVRWHVKKVLSKTQTRTRTATLLLFYRLALISGDRP